MTPTKSLICPYFLKALGYSVPIGGLSGLIGLGGGEFRLPVLIHVIGFNARSAIPLNLCISLATLAFALIARSHAVPVSAVTGHLPELLALAAGGIASAFYGTAVVHRLSDKRLLSLISVLLVALGCLLVVEAFLVPEPCSLVGDDPTVRMAVGFGIGLGVGAVSSILGVAGGELLIPALVLVFGADIKVAGTTAILISLAVVSTGVFRYWRAGAIPVNQGARRISAALLIGSLAGAALGGLAVAIAPTVVLKVLLGGILIAAGLRSLGKTE